MSQSVAVLGSNSVPLVQQVQSNQTLTVLTGTGIFDGSGASGDFLPCLSFYDSDNNLIARAKADKVTAGASAEVSWFPFGRVAAAAAGGGGIQFDVDNVGDWLEVETTGTVGDSFSQPNAAAGLETQFGTAFNVNNGLLLTAPPDSNFNSGNPILGVESIVATGDVGGFGQLIRVRDNTAGGSNTVTGEQIIAGADGSEAVTALMTEADMGSTATSDAYAVTALAANRGTGREVAIAAATQGLQTGANSLTLLCSDSSGNPTFEVRDDGSVHIKTGTLIVADL